MHLRLGPIEDPRGSLYGNREMSLKDRRLKVALFAKRCLFHILTFALPLRERRDLVLTCGQCWYKPRICTLRRGGIRTFSLVLNRGNCQFYCATYTTCRLQQLACFD